MRGAPFQPFKAPSHHFRSALALGVNCTIESHEAFDAITPYKLRNRSLPGTMAFVMATHCPAIFAIWRAVTVLAWSVFTIDLLNFLNLFGNTLIHGPLSVSDITSKPTNVALVFIDKSHFSMFGVHPTLFNTLSVNALCCMALILFIMSRKSSTNGARRTPLFLKYATTGRKILLK